jgi:hypothetical protein
MELGGVVGKLALLSRNVPSGGRDPEAAILAEVSISIIRLSKQFPGQKLKLSNDRFLPHTFQFISHQSSQNSALYYLSYRQRRKSSHT